MIRVIDYKAGNAASVLNAVRYLGFAADFARCADDIESATHIILPGTGSAAATMESLGEMGIIPVLDEVVLGNQVFFLGICVGMQILFEHSEEGNTTCLGWLKGRVVKFDSQKVRVPKMGWSKVVLNSSAEEYFYFVNSYYALPGDSADLYGVANYNGEFAAAVRRGNIFGTQFHAEKSGEAGLSLLRNFFERGML
ncbi:MAG: imidazole glycerol phosphate synthase subunit HisH [Defluviitaleaceae bacterium]|nr:imidazole glycerol phosphate synthase subunit HisH [Defluviitaleaceae bacterium]